MSEINFKPGKMHPFKQQEDDIRRRHHIPIAWLISSILFFLIVNVVAPVFWPQLANVGNPAELSALNILLGISGIVVYVTEPFIWHIYKYGAEKREPEEKKETGIKKEGRLLLVTGLVISTALELLISLLYIFIIIFKPVFRSMILYVSLSFLNRDSGNLGESPLFVIPVTTDILLYYLDMMAPEWKFNPVNVINRLIKIRNMRLAFYTGSILLIVHTALIYAFLLNVVYDDIYHHPEELKLKNLALWWLMLTVYTRLSFLTDEVDVAGILKGSSKKFWIINIIALLLSLIGFIWPYYFR